MISRKGMELAGGLLVLIMSTTAVHATRSVSYTYHPAVNGVPGQVATIDGPRTDVTDVTSFDYDSVGNLTTVTNALGHVTQITSHDASGRPLTLVDPNGVTTTLSYDARRRLASITVDGATTTLDYDPVGNLTTVTLPTAVTLTYSYDDASRLTAIEDALGNRIAYTLDAAGNRTEEAIRDAGGVLRYARTQAFDELSRLREIVGLDGTRYLDYDPNSNLTQDEDGRGNTTHHAFDALNRLTTTTDALQGQTDYSHDAQDRLTAVSDPRSNQTDYTYDDLGNVITVQSPDTGTTTYTYDAAGNRTSRTDAKGQVVDYTYDALNRLTHISYQADPSQNVTLQYDETSASHGIGRLTRITDPAGVTTFDYTARGQLASEARQLDGHTLTVSYGYDASGQLTDITYPSGRTVTYQRDAAGRISGVTTTQGGTPETLASTVEHLPFGPVAGISYGNGLTLQRQFDTHYRISQIALGSTLSRDYSYYDNDDLQSITPAASTAASFDYDPLRRLTDASGALDTFTWTYDSVGNRLSQTDSTGSTTYTLDPTSNQLDYVSDGTAYTYDANGNTLTQGNRSFDYDVFDRLSSVTDNGTPVATYDYNAFSQRVRKTVDGDTTLFVYDQAGQLLAEVDAATGATQVEYVWLEDMPLAIIHSGTGTPGTYFVHADHLHTPQVLTDDTGTVVWQADYTPFGEASVTTGTVTQNLRFPGQYHDQETGLHYNWHRYYDPGTGRYITSDPIGLAGGVNTYGYALAKPLKSVDPDGLDVETMHAGINIPFLGGVEFGLVRFSPEDEVSGLEDVGVFLTVKKTHGGLGFGRATVGYGVGLGCRSKFDGTDVEAAVGFGDFGFSGDGLGDGRAGNESLSFDVGPQLGYETSVTQTWSLTAGDVGRGVAKLIHGGNAPVIGSECACQSQ